MGTYKLSKKDAGCSLVLYETTIRVERDDNFSRGQVAVFAQPNRLKSTLRLQYTFIQVEPTQQRNKERTLRLRV